MTGNTLTDRYVAATLRTLPEKQRPDIEKELRVSIADAVDDRIEAGSAQDAAEREVLTELGDPGRLAASYTGRPLYLIGPTLFLDYLRLLKLLLWIVVPIVFVAIFTIDVFKGGSIGSNFGSAFAMGLTVGVHIAFWTTLVFAIVERTPTGAKSFIEWTPDMLADVPARRMAFAELVTGVVFGVLGIAALLISPLLTVTDEAGVPQAVLAPSLWDFWVPYLVVVAVIAIAFQFVTYFRGPSLPIAFGNLAINAAFGIPIVWLATTGQLLNPAFFDAIGWPEGDDIPGVMAAVIVIGTVVGLAWDSIDGFLKARRR